MKFLTVLFFVCTSLLLLYNCDTTEPPIISPPDFRKITLTFEDASCTEVWLRIKADSITLPVDIKLTQETAKQNITLTVKDTVLYIDSLLPNQTYNYQAVLSTDTTIKSEKVTAQTLASTSHDYTWQEFTIGDSGFSNALFDVWGTDENNVWAVGTVMINDTAYGVIKWNGIEWKPALRRGGYNSIYGFANNDIWAVGNVIYHFDGTSWTENRNQVLNDNIPYTSIWGTSSNNLYLGNAWGKIIHWDGTKASVLASFDGTNINDISGLINKGFYVVGSKNTINGNSIVAFYNFSSFQNYNDISLLNTSPLSVKMFTDNFVLIGGNNLFTKNPTGWNTIPINNYGTINKIRGDNTNNIFAVGFFKEAYHFSGLDWYKYSELSATHGVFNSVFVSGQRVFIVGQNETYNLAQIYIGVK